MDNTRTLGWARQLSSLDWMVFIGLIACSLAVALWATWRARSRECSTGAEDTVLMGRALRGPLFVATLVATWYGDIIGVTQVAFEHGIYHFLTQGLCWYLGYAAFAWLLAKKARKSRALSLPDLIHKRLGPRCASLASVLIVLKLLPVSYCIGIGFALKSLWPSLPLSHGMALGLVCVTAYSVFGGLRAVVWSDLIQCIAMYAAVLTVCFYSVASHGGLVFLKKQLHPELLNPTQGWERMLVWFLIASMTTFASPTFYQRCFAARSDRVAQWGTMSAIGLWILFDAGICLGGLYARACCPELPSASAYMHYALDLLPSGMRGLFLAGILSTLFSTVDSHLHLSASTLRYDLLPGWRLCPSHATLLLLVAALTFVLATQAQTLSFEALWLLRKRFYLPCLLAPILVCLLRPGLPQSDTRGLWALALGALTASLWPASLCDPIFPACFASVLPLVARSTRLNQGLCVATQRTPKKTRLWHVKPYS